MHAFVQLVPGWGARQQEWRRDPEEVHQHALRGLGLGQRRHHVARHHRHKPEHKGQRRDGDLSRAAVPSHRPIKDTKRMRHLS
jgi:hypothetical protein